MRFDTRFFALVSGTALMLGPVAAQTDRAAPARATAATPAMAMLGSAIGPVLAGTLLKMGDLELLGTVAIAIDALALLSLSVLGAHARRHVKPLAMARQ